MRTAKVNSCVGAEAPSRSTSPNDAAWPSIGCESPSIFQWYTAVSVTRPIVLTLIHFQKTTSSAMVCDFILLLSSMLKICSWRPSALSAMTLETGFIIAESAVIGRRVGCVASAMSMITTWFCSPTCEAKSGGQRQCRV